LNTLWAHHDIQRAIQRVDKHGNFVLADDAPSIKNIGAGRLHSELLGIASGQVVRDRFSRRFLQAAIYGGMRKAAAVFEEREEGMCNTREKIAETARNAGGALNAAAVHAA
jgi:hypothetical protein